MTKGLNCSSHIPPQSGKKKFCVYGYFYQPLESNAMGVYEARGMGKIILIIYMFQDPMNILFKTGDTFIKQRQVVL